MPGLNRHSRKVVAIAVLVLAACQPTVRPIVDVDPQVLADRAREGAAAGDHLAAARYYEQLASVSQGPARNEYRLNAAGQWYAAQRYERARNALAAIDEPTSASTRQRRTLLGARIDVASGDPGRALETVTGLGRAVDSDLAAETLAVQAEAQFSLGALGDAVQSLVDREIWLSNSEAIDDNHERIWGGMSEARASGYSIPTPQDTESIASGWLVLGQIGAESERNPFVFKTRLIEWRHAYPFHPASVNFVDRLLVDYRAQLDYPRQVALLLPLSGRQRDAAIAVRDGFLAAYLEHGGDSKPPSVFFYNTSSHGPADAYRQAVFDGADFVVGPLTKTEVSAVASVSRGHVPTLALNFLPDHEPAPAGFFQFSLSPEDEAAQVAQRVIDDGYTRGVALVPSNEWGLRQLQSFGDTLRELDGSLLAFKAYDPQSRDLSGPIADLLHVTESNSRRRRLSSDLGAGLEFSPRQRADAEFVFLVGFPGQGRMIKPLLEFHYAPNPPVPVYSTASIYEPDPKNIDLNGVIFNDMPWVLAPDPTVDELRGIIERYWPTRANRRARLYAMGFDAYRMVPLLHTGELASGTSVPGMTGLLNADDTQRIHRQLTWARFDRGRAVVIPSASGRPVSPDSGL